MFHALSLLLNLFWQISPGYLIGEFGKGTGQQDGWFPEKSPSWKVHISLIIFDIFSKSIFSIINVFQYALKMIKM